jgi:CheY-like chemotaxis protein
MSIVKVLLVDDVRLFLEFERSFFERAGCEIYCATSGAEALRLSREERPHIVLLDYEMPDIMGDEVCRQIREGESTRHIPVLIVTSHSSPEIREKCLAAGCTDFLSKPVSGRDLLDKVVTILQIPYRVHVRTRVQMDVEIEGGDQISVSGYSEDLSEGGLLVETLEPVDEGAEVKVSFTLPGQNSRFESQAMVVRVGKNDLGDRFSIALNYTSPEHGLVERLRSFVLQEVKK